MLVELYNLERLLIDIKAAIMTKHPCEAGYRKSPIAVYVMVISVFMSSCGGKAGKSIISAHIGYIDWRGLI